jgi:hypothetical protein
LIDVCGWFLLWQVVEVSTSKTGKHGHAKCHFVGIDIFTGKKLEDIVPSSHNCDVSRPWTRLDKQYNRVFIGYILNSYHINAHVYVISLVEETI